MEIEKSKVLIKFLLNFRQSGDVLFFLNVRRLRGYTATASHLLLIPQVDHPGIINHASSMAHGWACRKSIHGHSMVSMGHGKLCMLFHHIREIDDTFDKVREIRSHYRLHIIYHGEKKS